MLEETEIKILMPHVGVMEETEEKRTTLVGPISLLEKQNKKKRKRSEEALNILGRRSEAAFPLHTEGVDGPGSLLFLFSLIPN